ncbi:fatty acid synthase-like [Anoplophora glabripennis]|uniref:fatty acid synthase-like n=1 Tax=Anoplophora glabripennis TaxID=217634 RepID=UPI000C773503|nr:fatty acid synthase-like [Anoplophora glabripennis]
MVAAHKQEALSVDNIVDSVINTLGVRDVKQVSFQSTLAELGMNSLIAIEMKLTLQREFGISFSAKDLRSMTLARLKEIQKEKNGTSQVVEKNC